MSAPPQVGAPSPAFREGALRIVLFVDALLTLLLALGLLAAPGPVLDFFGFDDVGEPGVYFVTLLGASYLAFAVLLYALSRNPFRHRLLIPAVVVTEGATALASAIYAGSGVIDWAQGLPSALVSGFFAVALLALYPWRTGV